MTVIAQTGYQLFDQLARLGWSEEDRRAVGRAYELSSTLSAGIERPFGRSFLDHHVGTDSLVAEGGGRPALVQAALLHNVLGRRPHARWVQKARAPYHRRLTRRVAGDEVLRLVELYSASRGDYLVEDLGGQHGRDLGLIAVANALDDIVDGRGAYLPVDTREKQIKQCSSAVTWARDNGLDRLADIGEQAIEETRAVEQTAIGTPPLRGFRVLLRVATGWRNSDPNLTIILFDHRIRKLIDPLRRGWSVPPARP